MDSVFCCAFLAELVFPLLEILKQSIPGVRGDQREKSRYPREEEELGFLRLCPAEGEAVPVLGGSRDFTAEVKVLSISRARPELLRVGNGE